MLLRLNTSGAAERLLTGYRTDDHPRLDRIQNTISLVAGIIAGVAIVLMVVITCIEVISRVTLGQPLGWNVSFTEHYLMVGTAFFGIVLAYRSGAHVAVTSVFQHLSLPIRKTLQISTHIIAATVFALLFWFGLEATIASAQLQEIPPKGGTELHIPEWVWRSFIPIASIMAFVIAIIDLWREIVASWSQLATDYDPGETQMEEN